jgi:hypothetical protein
VCTARVQPYLVSALKVGCWLQGGGRVRQASEGCATPENVWQCSHCVKGHTLSKVTLCQWSHLVTMVTLVPTHVYVWAVGLRYAPPTWTFSCWRWQLPAAAGQPQIWTACLFKALQHWPWGSTRTGANDHGSSLAELPHALSVLGGGCISGEYDDIHLSWWCVCVLLTGP